MERWPITKWSESKIRISMLNRKLQECDSVLKKSLEVPGGIQMHLIKDGNE